MLVELAVDGGEVVASNKRCASFGVLDVWIPDVVAKPGETVVVPINIRNADGVRIGASDVWMDFDPRVMELDVATNDQGGVRWFERQEGAGSRRFLQ